MLEEYPLSIYSDEYDVTTVHAGNAADIFPRGVYKGLFSYDPASNTLTIHGDADLSRVSIQNEGLEGQTIQIEGKVSIELGWRAALVAPADTTLTGGGTLTLTGEADPVGTASAFYAIQAQRGAALRLEGIDVVCDGGIYCLDGGGDNGGGSRLILRSANLEATSSVDPKMVMSMSGAALWSFTGGVDLIDTALDESEGVYLQDGTVYLPATPTAPEQPALHARFTATAPLPARSLVTGTVCAADGEPAVNYPVRVGDQVVCTDENGRYTVEVYAGSQTVEVSDPSAGVYMVPVEVSVPADGAPFQPEPAAPYTPCRVRFDANGGFGEMAEAELNPEQPYELPDCDFAPPNETMMFECWDLGSPGDLVSIAEDTALTAQWRLVHVHSLVRTEYQEPSCTEAGQHPAWRCISCGRWFLDENCSEELDVTEAEELTIPPLDHEWVFQVWSWEEDNSAAAALFVCARDVSHTQSVPAAVTETIYPPQELQNGGALKRVWTAWTTPTCAASPSPPAPPRAA